jgi:CheY-like chemotaxis protein
MAKLTILLVEDNALNRELATDLLEVAGFRVLLASTAYEALALAQADAPHLILMDISLPDMDGLEATRRLKKEPRTSGIPVVALTAQAMPGDREKALAAGCCGYITKPIDTRGFTKTVLQFLPTAGP